MKAIRAFFNKHIRGDKVIWTIITLLSCISVLAVYSSTGQLSYSAASGYSSYFISKHVFILATALVFVFLAHKVKYIVYGRWSPYLLIGSIVLLLYALTREGINDASRWIVVGPISFQPSELAKVSLVLFISRLLTLFQSRLHDKKAFFWVLGSSLVVVGLIISENLSTALLLGLVCFMLMFVSGLAPRYVWGSVAIVVLLVSATVLVVMNVPDEKLPGRMDTWKSRIENFGADDGPEGYQALNAKMAVAKGGMLGVGPGNSSQKNFLPHPYSDYIYALIVEEYGVVGGMVILALYLWFLFRGIRVARLCPGSFGRYTAFGLTFMISMQAFVNMGVAVSLLPVTGQPLPFLSMGGSSIWITAIAVGILLSISASVEEKRKNEIQARQRKVSSPDNQAKEIVQENTCDS